MDKGIFTGVGVGPGDPELITIKAIKEIEEADVLVLPALDKESCRAYKIARAAFAVMGERYGNEEYTGLIDGKEYICEPFPMSMDMEERREFHKRLAGRIAEELDAGRNAVFLTIGDPAVYSTLDYIDVILRKMGYNTKRISGVTSFCAAADRLGISLGEDSESIHIIPGSADVEEALKLRGTKVFMKGGKRLKELKDRLIRYEDETDTRVYGVESCTLPDEKVAYRAGEITDDWGYMAVVIARGAD